jgi:uncharacterized integral membrane protein
VTEPLPPTDAPAPAEPSPPPSAPAKPGLGGRLQEGRRTFQPGLWIRLTVFAVVLVYLILFVVLNSHPVRVHWVFATTRVSLIWVIVLAGLIGIVLGVLASQVRRFRSRRRHAAREAR